MSAFASGNISPYGLAFDSHGDLFDGDSGYARILRFTPEGSQSTFSDVPGGYYGLAFDNAGSLFATVGDSIGRFASDGTMTTFVTGLDNPFGLAFDASGNLFEADDSSGNIFKFAPDGTKTTFATGLAGPLLIAFEPVTEKLRNISARGLVGTGDNVLIGGFIVGGNGLANNAVVARAIGPSLAQAGVNNPLPDPVLELHNSAGAIVASNDNWQDTQAAQIIAIGLAPRDPSESAVYATLPAGSYTAVVRGAGDTTGVGLVEVYSITQ